MLKASLMEMLQTCLMPRKMLMVILDRCVPFWLQSCVLQTGKRGGGFTIWNFWGPGGSFNRGGLMGGRGQLLMVDHRWLAVNWRCLVYRRQLVYRV